MSTQTDMEEEFLRFDERATERLYELRISGRLTAEEFKAATVELRECAEKAQRILDRVSENFLHEKIDS